MGDIVVEPGQKVYVATGELRPPREGEDYLIAPGTVGTSGGGDRWSEPEKIVRQVWPVAPDEVTVGRKDLHTLLHGDGSAADIWAAGERLGAALGGDE